MAVDFVKFPQVDNRMAIEEAASAGLKSMKHLIQILSSPVAPHHQLSRPLRSGDHVDCSQLTDFTVSNFKQVNSLLNRTGHARFRRAPPQNSTRIEPVVAPVIDLNVEAEPKQEPERPAGLARTEKDCLTLSQPVSSSTTSSSFLSTITGDGSVSNGKVGAALAAPPAPAFSARKPPLSSSHRKKCHERALSVVGSKISSASASAARCHCSKRR